MPNWRNLMAFKNCYPFVQVVLVDTGQRRSKSLSCCSVRSTLAYSSLEVSIWTKFWTRRLDWQQFDPFSLRKHLCWFIIISNQGCILYILLLLYRMVFLTGHLEILGGSQFKKQLFTDWYWELLGGPLFFFELVIFREGALGQLKNHPVSIQQISAGN